MLATVVSLFANNRLMEKKKRWWESGRAGLAMDKFKKQQLIWRLQFTDEAPYSVRRRVRPANAVWSSDSSSIRSSQLIEESARALA